MPRFFRRTSSSAREYDLRDLKPGLEEKKLTIEPVQGFDFDQYSQKFEQIIRQYEDKIFGIVNVDHVVMFRMLISKMGALEVARSFIALLYLVTKGKINLEQSEEDIKITIK